MNIEDFLKQNKDQFETCSDLPAGHQYAMLGKLKKRRLTSLRRLLFTSSAAAVAALIIVSMLVIKAVEVECDEPLSPALQELAELTVYYNAKRQTSIDSIELLLKGRNMTMQIEIKTQIRELSQIDNYTIPPMLLTIDADKYLALTVQKYEAQDENFRTLINILK